MLSKSLDSLAVGRLPVFVYSLKPPLITVAISACSRDIFLLRTPLLLISLLRGLEIVKTCFCLGDSGYS